MKVCQPGCRCLRHLAGLSPEAYIEKRILKTETCWFFVGRQGRILRNRPAFTVNGKRILISRYVLGQKLERPVADGMEACHTCDVGICIRPEHLFEGTHADNMADANDKGRLHQTPESKRRLSAAQTGVPESAETRAKLSAAHRGVPLSAAHRSAIARGALGLKRGPFSPAHRQALSEAQKRRYQRESRIAHGPGGRFQQRRTA